MKKALALLALALSALGLGLAAHAQDHRPQPFHPQTGMMMRPVICRVVEDGRGKSGQELAQAIEREGVQMALSNYQLSGILPGDPPILCFQSRADFTKLPPGAR